MADSQVTNPQLLQIDEDGRVPKSRLTTFEQARNIHQRLLHADLGRSKKRMMVQGLVDGNPPYKQSLLKAHGQDYRCNVNWRIAEAYLNNTVGAFYDVFQESPTYATVKTKEGNEEQRSQWSKIITEHFDYAQKADTTFDYNVVVSQHEMVAYAVGPLVFPDTYDWRPISVLCGQLKVPDRTKSSTEYWELAVVEVEYDTARLYEKIVDEKTAKALGWNVKLGRQAIMKASPDYKKGGIYQTWEYWQQQLKQNSLAYGMCSNTVRAAHFFYREYPTAEDREGKISHKIIVSVTDNQEIPGFLYEKEKKWDNWNQCIHPMYYDHGGGGFHHSVTGQGKKMYSAMVFQNRLLCNLGDKAFAPKLVFRPTTANQAEQFSQTMIGECAVTPAGFELLQTPVAGIMEEGVVFNREVSNLISSNLSSYRTNATESSKGNPDTATQVKLDASKEASLQKTQLNRYYQQLDGLYAEKFRRIVLCPKNVAGGDIAEEFRQRCLKDGVPLAALKNIECVKAYRVIGQGSQFMREQSLEFLLSMVGMLPEGGRDHLLQDVIASRAGQSAVNRYYPAQERPNDQNVIAALQISAMKDGVPAVIADNQNPVIFAQAFLQAGAQAVQSMQQGADPREVVAFLELDGQAIAAHLQRIQQDPTRKQVFKVLEAQFKQLAQIHDQLMAQIQQDEQQKQQRAAELQQQQQDMMGEMALAKQRQDFDLGLKQQKTQFGMADKAAKTQQGLAINDALAAQKIKIAHQQNQADLEKKRNGSGGN